MQRDERGVQTTGRPRKVKEPLFAVELVDGIRVAIVCGRLYKIVGDEFVPVDRTDFANKWIVSAWYNSPWVKEDGRYTAVGAHIKGNPYGLDDDFLEKDGRIRITDRLDTEDDIRGYFRAHSIYGIVFLTESGKVERIVYRTQYGLRWPTKESETADGK